MQKLASPQELQAELQRLIATCAGPDRPSRVELASELRSLAERVAMAMTPEERAKVLKLRKSERAIQKLKAAGYEPRSYSGRGMYGRYCVGVTVSRSYVDDVKKLIRGASTDSMGMDVIVYWPFLPWPGGD